MTGSRSEIVFEALPTDDPQVRQPDITLAREMLGWEPEVELREGLRRTIDEAGVEALVGARTAEVRRARARHPRVTLGPSAAVEPEEPMQAGDVRRDRRSRATAGGPPYRAPVAAPPARDVRPSARRRSPSCCAWRRCGALARVALAAGARLRRRVPAIFTALMHQGASLPRRLRRRTRAGTQTRDIVPSPTSSRAAVRALGPLRRARRSARGCTRIVACLFQVTVVALIFAVVNGDDFSSYYIFYGSLFFAVVYVSLAALRATSGSRARCCARPATGAGRCSSAPASRSRRSRTRWPTRAHGRSRSSATSR